MKFLGGFLKFLGILLMLIGTALGTIACVVGVEDGDPGLYGVGAVIFLCFLFVALGVLGTGMALSQVTKLKKRITQLEQRLWSVPAAVPEVKFEQPQPAVVAPVAEMIAPSPVQSTPDIAAVPAKMDIKRWLPVIIAAVLALVAVIAAIVIVSGGKEKPSAVEEAPAIQEEQHPEPLPPLEMEEFEPIEGPAKIEVVELPVGSTLSTGFMDMTFDEVVIQEDIQKSVTVDHVTRVTGPEPLPGQQYICLSGRIINTSTSALPVYDFFEGRFAVGEYNYAVSANDCDVLSPDGEPQSSIDPLMEYEYRIYAAIPEELAAAGLPCSFTFGFYDNFDNKDLSYNRAFAEDPIAECPYQYFVPFQ